MKESKNLGYLELTYKEGILLQSKFVPSIEIMSFAPSIPNFKDKISKEVTEDRMKKDAMNMLSTHIANLTAIELIDLTTHSIEFVVKQCLEASSDVKVCLINIEVVEN